jgi:CRISPR-associated protein Csy1
MAYQLHKSISECRYGDSVDVRKARRAGNHSDSIDQKFPDLAYLSLGGANPRNVSLLNNSRGGTFFLFNAAPPAFKGLKQSVVKKEKVFCTDHSIFSDNFDEKTASLVRRFIYFIENSLPRSSTVELRTNREVEYTLPIVDVMLQHASIIQSYKEAGWSLSEKCNMKQSHSLWLDPMNSDLEFQVARESKDWIDGVATDFADWLVSKLPSALFELGDAEHYYFKKTCLDELVVFERSTPKFGTK